MAQVTFYSNAAVAKELLPIPHGRPFSGYLFDGPEPLLILQRGQFATFALPTGPHQFSATLPNHPADNSNVPVLLSAGEHYFFAVSMDVGAISQKGVLEQVDCKTAEERAVHTHSAPVQHLSGAYKERHVTETSFPGCAP